MRTMGGALGDVLFGKVRGGILRLLYGQHDKAFYVRQIAREVGSSVGAVQRELETLSYLKLIRPEKSGNQVYYRVNPDHPVYAEMRSLVAKTVGSFELLRTALKPLAKYMQVAFVYGSMARGEEKDGSDVDLMIVGDVTLDEVLTKLARVQKAIGRPVNPTIYSSAEFKAKLKARNHFLAAVMRGEKVAVVGTEDELEKMGRVRMAQAGAD